MTPLVSAGGTPPVVYRRFAGVPLLRQAACLWDVVFDPVGLAESLAGRHGEAFTIRIPFAFDLTYLVGPEGYRSVTALPAVRGRWVRACRRPSRRWAAICGWRQYFRAPTGTMPGDVAHTWPIPEELHYGTWIAERTDALMRDYHGRGEPFFLWASFPDPPPPYLVPQPWDRMYDPEALTVPQGTAGEHDRNPPHFALTQTEQPDFSRWNESGQIIHGFESHLRSARERRRLMATYYGMVSMLDRHVGRVLDSLDDLGIADNTIVVFTTDHDHFFGQQGLQAKGPFRALSMRYTRPANRDPR